MTNEQQERWELLRQAAAITYPDDHGEWVYDEWASHNGKYFDGELVPAPITWGIMSYGPKVGRFSPWVRRISLHRSMIRGKKRPTRLASDVLLHEMIHQYLHQMKTDVDLGRGEGKRYRKSSHNNPLWVAEVNRIAPLLGLPANAVVIEQKRIKGKVTWFTPDGKMTRRELSSWPHYARPTGYYEIDVEQQYGENFKL